LALPFLHILVCHFAPRLVFRFIFRANPAELACDVVCACQGQRPIDIAIFDNQDEPVSSI
jgi:hypothetical protein